LITRHQVRQREMSATVCKFFEDGGRRVA
jgi:hypothetical protein